MFRRRHGEGPAWRARSCGWHCKRCSIARARPRCWCKNLDDPRRDRAFWGVNGARIRGDRGLRRRHGCAGGRCPNPRKPRHPRIRSGRLVESKGIRALPSRGHERLGQRGRDIRLAHRGPTGSGQPDLDPTAGDRSLDPGAPTSKVLRASWEDNRRPLGAGAHIPRSWPSYREGVALEPLGGCGLRPPAGCGPTCRDAARSPVPASNACLVPLDDYRGPRRGHRIASHSIRSCGTRFGKAGREPGRTEVLE